jgi:hypothetical protein
MMSLRPRRAQRWRRRSTRKKTLGKLKDAIKLYEEVIAEATAARGLAGPVPIVYEKQGKQTAATTAFEKRVKGYPKENDLVAKARAKLPSAITLEPVP